MRPRPPQPTSRPATRWCEEQTGCGAAAEILVLWFTSAAEGQIVDDDGDEEAAEIQGHPRPATRRWRHPSPSTYAGCKDHARTIYIALKQRALEYRTPPPWHQPIQRERQPA